MQIVDQVLFKDYSRNPAGYEPVLTPGDTCIVEKIDRDVALTVRTIPDHPRRTVTEWVFLEEVMPLANTARSGDPRPNPRPVLRMMARENTKDCSDLSDRVAYIYVTGAHPTNVQSFFTGALDVLSKRNEAPGCFGPFLIESSAIHTLNLDNHPMVVEARRLLSEGWRLVVSRGPNRRRPFGNLYFSREQHRLTLHSEGWIRAGWPQDWPRGSTRRWEVQEADFAALLAISDDLGGHVPPALADRFLAARAWSPARTY